jgi:hypothetical protein
MWNIYMGYPPDGRAAALLSIKSAAPNDLYDLARSLELMAQRGLRATAGGQAAILANANLFENIIYAFGEPDENAAPIALTRLEFLQILFQTDQDIYDTAVSMGIMLSIAAPDDPLTREELAYVLLVASGIPFEVIDDSTLNITDTADISDWALPAVKTALSLELMQLDDEGRFNPKAVVTLMDFMMLMQ